MIKTYSEQRQAILFKASRELRLVACQVLDDVRNPVELASDSTLSWAKSVARHTAEMATELEDRGHEEAIASPRAETDMRRSHGRYQRSIDAFQARILDAGGKLPA
jgi:hypothetical protein